MSISDALADCLLHLLFVWYNKQSISIKCKIMKEGEGFAKPQGEKGEVVYDITPKVEGEIICLGEGFKKKLADMIEQKGMLPKMGCDRETVEELIDMFSPEDIEELTREIKDRN